MAAGKSTRTYPLTLTKPKPLLPIANTPILAHQLDQLVGLVDEVIIIVGYQSEMIRNYFGDSYRGLPLGYIEQREQLGTGHAAMQVSQYISDRFLIMNGDDLYAREDIEACLQYPYALLVQEIADPRQYGVLVVENGLVKNIVEKPANPPSNLVNAGVYVFDKKIFALLETIPRSPRGEYEITDGVKALAQMAEMHYHISPGDWIPIGFPWHILTANDFLLERKFGEPVINGVIEEGVKIDGKVALGEQSIIRQGTYIQGNLCVGRNCIIGPYCHITGNTSIGNNCAIGNGTRLNNCVIDQDVRIDPVCHIAYSILGEGVSLHTGTVTMTDPIGSKTVLSVINGQRADSKREHFGATIGGRVSIQPHVVLYPGVKIWPEKVITAGTVVTGDLM